MAKRSKYENTIANKLSLGVSAAVRRGRSPGLEGSKGVTTSVRRGRSPAEAAVKGAPLAARRATGGPTGAPDSPHYAKGGNTAAHKKAHKQVYSLYKMLHSHFNGGSERGFNRNSRGR